MAVIKSKTNPAKSYTYFGVVEDTRKARRCLGKQWATMVKKFQADDVAASAKVEEDFPRLRYGKGGPNRPRSMRGTKRLRTRKIPATAHSAATSFPYVAGPALGADGVYIGTDQNGGGAFNFDPWELYAAELISGMSMMLFGQVGTGKSSLAKSFVVRQVQAGRKASVASDSKGEWTVVAHAVGGSVIQVGPGLDTRLNPLDPGTRPSTDPAGMPLDDQAWASMVRTRRMSILGTLGKILANRDLSPTERHVLSMALDAAVAQAGKEKRSVVIPDVIVELEAQRRSAERMESDAAAVVSMVMHRVTDGDLEGMFDGETTAKFDADAPMVSIDTSSLKGASPEAARVANACTAAWTEAMITNADSGQRIVVYEEGWDNISSEADLQRMVQSWKLARAYGIFNILILHKLADLDMSGDQGSRMEAMAKSLLADADVKVIYRQDSSALSVTMKELDLSDRERGVLKNLDKGVGLWRLGQASFQVQNELSVDELRLFDTDQRMTENDNREAEKEAVSA